MFLENILCDNQAELILVNQSNHTIIQLNQSIDIFVRLHPNCPLVQPHDETITEISHIVCSSFTNDLGKRMELKFYFNVNFIDVKFIPFVLSAK